MNDWYIELFEDFPTDRKEQSNKREVEVIREIGTINKRIEGREHKEWKEANKDKIKEYYEANKGKKLERKKEYSGTNKDKLTDNNKEY